MPYALECRFYEAHVHKHHLKSEKVKPTFLCTTPRDLCGVPSSLNAFARQAVNFIYFCFN